MTAPDFLRDWFAFSVCMSDCKWLPNATGLLRHDSVVAKFDFLWDYARGGPMGPVWYSQGIKVTVTSRTTGRLDEEYFSFDPRGGMLFSPAIAGPAITRISIGASHTVESPAVIWDAPQCMMWWHNKQVPLEDALCKQVNSYLDTWLSEHERWEPPP